MSIVPYREIRRRTRRRPIDRTQIVKASLALLDEVGLERLTMRRVSERLGIRAPSLYRHVRGKDELLQLLADEISGEIPLPSASGTWQDQVREMARNTRRGLLARRDAAQLLAMTAPFGPQRLRHIEAALRVLRLAGLSRRHAAQTAYHFNNLVTEFVADESRYASMAGATATTRRKLYADARRYFKALPAAEFPVIVDLADYLGEDDPDGLFDFGVDVWLRGLEALSRKKP